MRKKEILAKIQKQYKPGTIMRSVHNGVEIEITKETLEEMNIHTYGNGQIEYVSVKDPYNNSKIGTIYYNKKWASRIVKRNSIFINL